MSTSTYTAQRGATFSLNVTLGFGADNKAEQELNKACPRQTFSLSELASTFFESNQDQDKLFVASASEVRLRVNPPEKFWKTNTQLVIVFMPPHMIASAIKDHCSSNQVASGSSFWVNRPASANFVKDLLPKIHPTALAGCRIRGIILTSIAASNGPAELLILEVPKGRSIQEDILQETNGCTIAGDSDSGILKILPLTTIEFTHEEDDGTSDSEKKMNSTEKLSASTKALQIPACPVCIHRIDPSRFGLPRPCAQHLCSNFCPSPCSMVEERCHKQSLLNKWALPARCKACQVIDRYWNYSDRKHSEDSELFCEQCSMQKTLWTCLTCGFVGCGRRSNKHSVAHFEQTGHPYTLELATLRIWDYGDGEDGDFIQRADLLQCPSSPPLLYPLLYPWLTRELDFVDRSQPVSSFGRSMYNSLQSTSSSGKSSKKVMMVGEEYEALLQSALEDQAQHYEDEITRLRASYTESLVDRQSIIPEEAKEIEVLQTQNRITRENIRKASVELIEAQGREAELRAVSGRLLLEQKESNDLLKKIQEQHRREAEEGRLLIEDLEQQIADLQANLRMRQQFSQNNELANAQIFGTTSVPDPRNSGGKKGKRKGRYSRK